MKWPFSSIFPSGLTNMSDVKITLNLPHIANDFKAIYIYQCVYIRKFWVIFCWLNALLCSQRVNVLVLPIIIFYILYFSQANNIADPNVIIFEMTKDDRKDFYRTIGKQIVL